MNDSHVEQLWTIVNRFEDLLGGGIYRELPPCPVVMKQIPSSVTEEYEQLVSQIEGCNLCPLSQTRSGAIVGDGSIGASVFMVNSTVSEEDDSFGQILSGGEGDYLEKWLESISISRKRDCYFTSVVKCMTPGGRNPLQDEHETCLNYLKSQIQILAPKVIVALGPFVYSVLSNQPAYSFQGAVDRLRIVHAKELLNQITCYEGVPIIPLYHPNQVLENPDLRRPVWDLLKKIKMLAAGV